MPVHAPLPRKTVQVQGAHELLNGGRSLTEKQFQTLWRVYSEEGKTINKAATSAGVGFPAAKSFLLGNPNSSGHQLYLELSAAFITGVIPLDRLTDPGLEALDDFEFFRKYCLGRDSTPWQLDAAGHIIELIEEGKETEEKMFGVINAPPGAGKSTLFTCDLPLWLICRDRSIRILIGSVIQKLARQMVTRIKRELERPFPVDGAISTVPKLFGVFETDHDKWTQDELVVQQHKGVLVADKESTVTAFGMDSSYIGQRVDVALWDDLVDKKSIRSITARENLEKQWDEVTEARIDHGGVCLPIGQRLDGEDLYNHCLQKLDPYTDEQEDMLDAGANPDDIVRTPQYRAIKYQAHDESACVRDHGVRAKPWEPDGTGGCLLDPRNLKWRELKRHRENDPRRYSIVYQQEDADPESLLVKPVWVNGGIDEGGIERPGCWDEYRGIGELPKGLDGQLLSYATVDPSGKNMWAIQWWIHHPDTNQHFVMDVIKASLEAPDLLEFNLDRQEYTGVMAEWQDRSVSLGWPIKYWVVEQNAAQRYMLQYMAFKRWCQTKGVTILPHTTGVNKTDEKLGVESIAPNWKHGRIRLPGASRAHVMPLVKEVTHYVVRSDHKTASLDDQVMAHWFGQFQLEKMLRDGRPRRRKAVNLTPRWVQDRYARSR